MNNVLYKIKRFLFYKHYINETSIDIQELLSQIKEWENPSIKIDRDDLNTLYQCVKNLDKRCPLSLEMKIKDLLGEYE